MSLTSYFNSSPVYSYNRIPPAVIPTNSTNRKYLLGVKPDFTTQDYEGRLPSGWQTNKSPYYFAPGASIRGDLDALNTFNMTSSFDRKWWYKRVRELYMPDDGFRDRISFVRAAINVIEKKKGKLTETDKTDLLLLKNELKDLSESEKHYTMRYPLEGLIPGYDKVPYFFRPKVPLIPGPNRLSAAPPLPFTEEDIAAMKRMDKSPSNFTASDRLPAPTETYTRDSTFTEHSDKVEPRKYRHVQDALYKNPVVEVVGKELKGRLSQAAKGLVKDLRDPKEKEMLTNYNIDPVLWATTPEPVKQYVIKQLNYQDVEREVPTGFLDIIVKWWDSVYRAYRPGIEFLPPEGTDFIRKIELESAGENAGTIYFIQNTTSKEVGILIDYRGTQSFYDYLVDAASQILQKVTSFFGRELRIVPEIGKGVYAKLMTMEPQIKAAVDEIFNQGYNITSIIIGGHSLAGGLAQATSIIFSQILPPTMVERMVAVYYESMRILDVNSYIRLARDPCFVHTDQSSIRLRIEKDAVTHVPTQAANFVSIGNLVTLHNPILEQCGVTALLDKDFNLSNAYDFFGDFDTIKGRHSMIPTSVLLRYAKKLQDEIYSKYYLGDDKAKEELAESLLDFYMHTKNEAAIQVLKDVVVNHKYTLKEAVERQLIPLMPVEIMSLSNAKGMIKKRTKTRTTTKKVLRGGKKMDNSMKAKMAYVRSFRKKKS